jgi:hypothetical protein
MEHDQPERTAPGVEPSPESDFEFCSEQTFQVGVNHSQKESRCQTKRSKSPGAENRSQCALLTLSVPLRPRRDAPSLLLSEFSMELEARDLRLRNVVTSVP